MFYYNMPLRMDKNHLENYKNAKWGDSIVKQI